MVAGGGCKNNAPSLYVADPFGLAWSLAGVAENHPSVLVVDYDPSWPGMFEALRRPVWAAVQDLAVSVEHVGSTAVPGLAAKPIIDMDVVLASSDNMSEAIEKLATLGYVHRGNLGIEDREAFESPRGLPAHHLYVCPQGSAPLANHLALRDFLRRDVVAVAEYGRIKKQLAARFSSDIDSYFAGKTDFILTVLRNLGLRESVLQTIRDANLTSPNR
jgi:GrpB-like predicted nucleotidyltransferase (UPF0157 family)